MVYLSQLLNKTVYQDGKPFGRIVDIAIFENRPIPPVSKIEIKHGKEKLTIAPQALSIKDHRLTLNSTRIPLLPYDHKDFYLAEDLLDKQVIDVDGKRLVRVNDVILEDTDELKVVGIDISFAGILRRLGLGKIATSTTVIPWSVIEAFDYQTGNIRIKLKQSSLNTLHPADLADILEEVGTKERVGIVEALDARKAAKVLEETDDETQVSILENLATESIKNIINKMPISDIADVFNDLNPKKAEEIQSVLGVEKSQHIKRLLSFSDNVAGGLMHVDFFHADAHITVKELFKELEERSSIPETIIVTNGENKIVGIITTKDLVVADKLAHLQGLVSERKFVYPQTSLADIMQLFAQYNLRVVPVVDKEKIPIGIILIDDMLKIIQQEQEKDENI